MTRPEPSKPQRFIELRTKIKRPGSRSVTAAEPQVPITLLTSRRQTVVRPSPNSST